MSDVTREPQRALNSAVDDEDWDRVTALIAEHWSGLILNDASVLLGALERLPAATLAAQPRYLAARTYLRHLSDGAGRVHRYRHSTFERPTALLDVLVEHTSRAAAARSAGHVAAAIAHVERARDALRTASTDAAEAAQSALPHLHAQWARVREFAGQIEQAVTEYQDAYDLAVLQEDDLIRASASASLAGIHALAGHSSAATYWSRIAAPDSLGRAAAKYGVPARIAQALREHDRLHPDAAQRTLAAIDPATLGEYWAHMLHAKARITSAEDASALLTEIDVTAAAHPGPLSEAGLAGELLACARIDLLLRRGDLLRATAVLERAEDALARGSRVDGFDLWPAEPSHLTLARARVESASGQHRRALATLTPLVEHAGSSPRLLIETLMTAATACLHLKEPENAAGAMHHAVRLAREYDLAGSLSTVGRRDFLQLTESAALGDDDLTVLVQRTARFLDAASAPQLTARERAVLRELATGATTAQIAERLFVSPNTVKTQLSSAYRKLGVASRKEAEAAVRRLGLS
ncbi:LuxR C-terminal-related transcriptional regulator [Microbacterium sp. BG28]|uniref:LuxR C-terminal-related transcriptional regulator n=1 Tax=Microbacterium sp. BG28 TaxID=3097356 RepID=UPI002A5AB091|nr:LuxR C-terminal-related transcriptional regulator [Microbacterium sp. BG28]MDY0830099.1 LuxR C-terminal-related transcriptional regulator [Microbacterium sp. BG28]